MIIGIDFGTSNSACSVRVDSGEVKPVILEEGSSFPTLLPSYWYFPEGECVPLVGRVAKSAFIESGYEGRFLLSVKSHLSNLELEAVNIHGRALSLEKIVSFTLKRIKDAVENQFGEITKVYAGRPVVLSKSHKLDQQIEKRISEAYRMAGYPDPTFVLEPIAAAHKFKQQIREKELVFVCDFGGGTLDYCLAALEPLGSDIPDTILGVHGVRIGGDDLTGSLMRLFWDFFGRSSRVLDFTRRQWLPFPASIFSMLSDWKNIWRIKSIATNVKEHIKWGSDDPEALQRLVALTNVENYFEFLDKLDQTKILLSFFEAVDFSFHRHPIEIDRVISRSEFDAVASNIMKHAEAGIYKIFDGLNVVPRDVKTVFLTGGSSNVPAYRSIVERVFGKEKVHEGDTFTSVASGLAAYQP